MAISRAFRAAHGEPRGTGEPGSSQDNDDNGRQAPRLSQELRVGKQENYKTRDTSAPTCQSDHLSTVGGRLAGRHDWRLPRWGPWPGVICA